MILALSIPSPLFRRRHGREGSYLPLYRTDPGVQSSPVLRIGCTRLFRQPRFRKCLNPGIVAATCSEVRLVGPARRVRTKSLLQVCWIRIASPLAAIRDHRILWPLNLCQYRPSAAPCQTEKPLAVDRGPDYFLYIET
jgi:hypothetical protein